MVPNLTGTTNLGAIGIVAKPVNCASPHMLYSPTLRRRVADVGGWVPSWVIPRMMGSGMPDIINKLTAKYASYPAPNGKNKPPSHGMLVGGSFINSAHDLILFDILTRI